MQRCIQYFKIIVFIEYHVLRYVLMIYMKEGRDGGLDILSTPHSHPSTDLFHRNFPPKLLPRDFPYTTYREMSEILFFR
jgi:hypothetical protein